MLANWLRREYARLLASGAQLLLVIVGMRLDSRRGWLYCLAAIALIRVFTWVSSLRRLRTLRNTPTSKIVSAAQGYVELVGRGAQFCEPPLLSPLRKVPCLWSRYRVEESDRSEWRTVDSGETSNSFMLRDETGECVIDPEHAEIVTRHCDEWQQENCRYTEWTLIEQDPLYVIGQFRTRSDGDLLSDERQALSQLLADWKAGERQKTFEELEQETAAAKKAAEELSKNSSGRPSKAAAEDDARSTAKTAAPATGGRS